MGTTKLTRKEILAEDPIHAAMIRIVETARSRGQVIAIVAGILVLLAVGTYFGLRYLDAREMRAQEEFSRGIDFFHAQVDPAALDDPYGKGPQPLFRTEEARYKAAADVFEGIVSGYGSSRLAVMARYYLGLSQMYRGQKEAAIRNLEQARNNTKDRTVGYLAKKVLAVHYTESGNHKEAVSILEGMIKDPQCELPKEILRLDLTKAYLAAGNREEAAKILKQAREDSKPSMLNSMAVEELEKLQKSAGASNGTAKPESPHP